MESSLINGILRTVVSLLEFPVIIILLLLMAATVVAMGSILVEAYTERRLMKEKIPVFVTKLEDKDPEEQKLLIADSGLLARQKEALSYLLEQEGMPQEAKESLARQLLYEEEKRYQKTVMFTDVITRIAPMFGLLGTLIPLGPGLIALSSGDTATLSRSLMTAFDTTAAGLIVAAVSFLISALRKRWYEGYAVGMETLMEILLAGQKDRERKWKDA